MIEPVVGFVYILSNPSMPGLVKIGCSTRDVSTRIEELSNHTGVPAPFKEEARFAVESPILAERKIHDELAPFRNLTNREFFRISTQEAIEAVARIAGDPVFHAESFRNARKKKSEELRQAVRNQIRAEPRSSGTTLGGFGSSRYETKG